MKYTEEQLKSALVAALPDLIDNRIGKGGCWPYAWKSHDNGVTEHEWPAIVGMVEDGLTDEQKNKYHRKLQGTLFHWWIHVLLSKWQARAQALADIDAITIK